MRLKALIIIFWLVIAGPLLAQGKQASTLYEFNIRSQVIEEALSELAYQAGCQLLFSYKAVEQQKSNQLKGRYDINTCLLYTSPSPRDQRGSRMPSSA